MEVRLALSPKQHSSLRLGRKVRISTKHLHESGMPYTVRPETYDKIARAFDRSKGIDLALDPSEIHASGGSLMNKLKHGAEVLHFIGNEIIQPIATFIAPVAKPIISAGTDAAVATIEKQYNPGKYYGDQAERYVGMLDGHPASSASYAGPSASPAIKAFAHSMEAAKNHWKQSGQVVDYVAASNAANVVANAYTPYAAPPPPPPAPVGTVTPTYRRGSAAPVASSSGRSFHSGAGLYLGHVGKHRGHIHGHGLSAVNARHIDVMKIVRSEPHAVGFMQQLPIVFKDSARIGAGLYLS